MQPWITHDEECTCGVCLFGEPWAEPEDEDEGNCGEDEEQQDEGDVEPDEEQDDAEPEPEDKH